MSAETRKLNPRTVLRIAVNVLVYAFLIFCALALIMFAASKPNDGRGAELFGRQYLTVLTNSMEKCEETDVSMYEIQDIPVDSLISVDPVPDDPEEADEWYASLKKGDVLTFRYHYVQQVTITHRITDIEKNADGNGYTIYLEGDNKASDANTLTQVIDTSKTESPNHVIGKVTSINYFLGWLVSLIKSKVGIVCFIIIPCAALAIYEIVCIVSVVSKKKRKDTEQMQNEEMDALKRELEELRRMAAAGGAMPVASEAPDGDTSTDGEAPERAPDASAEVIPDGEATESAAEELQEIQQTTETEETQDDEKEEA